MIRAIRTGARLNLDRGIRCEARSDAHPAVDTGRYLANAVTKFGWNQNMVYTMRDLMTPDPVTLPHTATLSDAAIFMAQQDIGDVIVETDGAVCGLVTDRDIVVRAIAEGLDPQSTTLGEVCSRELVTLTPGDSADDAVRLMRERSVRRIPITEDGNVVGVITLGDLAVERDPSSALADISSTPGNH